MCSPEWKKVNWRDVLSGVPQGSVLEPILLLIFINDLSDEVRCIDLLLCRWHQAGAWNSKPTVMTCTSAWISFKWADRWEMAFNVNKCKLTHVVRRNPGSWSPWSTSDTDSLKRIQNKSVRQISGLLGKMHEEQLIEQGLESLGKRRTSLDLIQTFKILRRWGDKRIFSPPSGSTWMSAVG